MWPSLERHSAFARQVLRGAPARPGPVRLTRRNIYILPTRSGLLFALVLAVMLLGSLNYNNNLGFILTFLLTGMALVSILYGFRNLNGLNILPGRPGPVFAGGLARFPCVLHNPDGPERLAVTVRSRLPAGNVDRLAASGQSEVILDERVERRGLARPGPLSITTTYPLGLFRVWSRINLDMACVVYPHPAEGYAPLPPASGEAGAGGESGSGQDDFSGFRRYAYGDSPRHVAWKAVAAGRGMLVKEFHGAAPATLWLDYAGLAGLDAEERLSRLCRWILDAEEQGRDYGLRLPGQTLPPGRGEVQRQECLTALALFDPDGPAQAGDPAGA